MLAKPSYFIHSAVTASYWHFPTAIVWTTTGEALAVIVIIKNGQVWHQNLLQHQWIKEETIEILSKQNLDTKDSLILIMELDVANLQMTVGQHKPLAKAIEKL